jgi:F420-0:gamma-glutamyl ligase-like protein
MLQENKEYQGEEFAYYVNPGRKLEIQVSGKTFFRHAIVTHFVEAGKENYIDLVQKYVSPIYREGDILSMSENVIALCQNRIIRKEDLKLGFWAKFLSKLVYKNPGGYGLRQPYKMAIAIKLAGLPRVLFAAVISAICKLFGKRGVFYKIVGHNVANVDGFVTLASDYYADKGVLSPENPYGVCKEIKEKTGVDNMIVDANDLGVEILGVNSEVPYTIEELAAMIKDNPAGQKREMTPFILVREKKVVE